ILLTDEALTDITANLPAPLQFLARARQAKSTDLFPLTAGSVLGTCNGGDATKIFGISFPVSDQLAITPEETTLMLTRTADFNNAIAEAVAANSTRLALADVNKAYKDFVTARGAVSNGVFITPSFAPPTGAFSEDGLHPNSRGYAFTANVFIDAINAKFGSTIPRANLANYKGTGLPVNP
ncbi:MAG TPA: hypothetical protein DCE81_11450, partial [Cytophagales bacterium]|nr:hypothetical protein [Cytophagales bacterium]